MCLRLLLDTLVLIWAVATPERMDNGLREAMAAAENQVFVSSASIWEIAIKQAAGRLVFPLEQFDEIARRMGVRYAADPAGARDRRGVAAAASSRSV